MRRGHDGKNTIKPLKGGVFAFAYGKKAGISDSSEESQLNSGGLQYLGLASQTKQTNDIMKLHLVYRL